MDENPQKAPSFSSAKNQMAPRPMFQFGSYAPARTVMLSMIRRCPVNASAPEAGSRHQRMWTCSAQPSRPSTSIGDPPTGRMTPE